MMGNPNQPIFILSKDTERIKGRPAMSANISAAKAVSEAVRTTLGPLGMDKMLVQGSTQEILITNDGATILGEIEIEHPCAKLIVETSKTQEHECYDGTTSAVVLTGAILKASEPLLEQDVHPTILCKGFRKAEKLVLEELEAIGWKASKEDLFAVAGTALTGKSAESSADVLGKICVDALDAVATKGKVSLDHIKVLSFEGGMVSDSELVNGVILEKEKLHTEMVGEMADASVLLMTTPLDVKDTKFDAQLQITDPNQVKDFLEQEESALRDMAAEIAVHGVNVVFCGKEVDDLCAHYLSKLGITCYKRVKKSDMDAIARVSGARLVSKVEEIDPDDLGIAQISSVEYGDHNCTLIKSDEAKSVSVALKGATTHSTAEVERAFDDALGVCSIAYTEPVIAGGGSIYAHLARHLREHNVKGSDRESMAIEAYANALESIPRTLAENAGLDPVDALFDLRKIDSHTHGISTEGEIIDMVEANVIEPRKVVSNAIGCATESAIMVLRIDDVIASKGAPTGMPDMAGMGGIQ